MREGQTTDLTIRVVNGGLPQIDVAGKYWTTDEQVSLADGEYAATATLTKDGGIGVVGTVLVDLGPDGEFVFAGPVICE